MLRRSMAFATGAASVMIGLNAFNEPVSKNNFKKDEDEKFDFKPNKILIQPQIQFSNKDLQNVINKPKIPIAAFSTNQKQQESTTNDNFPSQSDDKNDTPNDKKSQRLIDRFKNFSSVRKDVKNDDYGKLLDLLDYLEANNFNSDEIKKQMNARIKQIENEMALEDFYMTPRDFLDSITKGEPDPDLHRVETLSHYMENHSLQKMVEKLQEMEELTDSKKNDTSDLLDINFLSKFQNSGLINYYDFVFLHSIISKSEHKLHLAFNLLDYNGDGTIDSYEYGLLERMISGNTATHHEDDKNNSWLNDFQGLGPIPNLMHFYFFGADGEKVLTEDRFEKFCKIIQREVLQHEFRVLMEEEAEGEEQDAKSDTNQLKNPTKQNPHQQKLRKLDLQNDYISAKSFATSILRNTQLDSDDIKSRINNLQTDHKISFNNYLDFSTFLLSIEDIAEILKFIEKNEIEHTVGPKQFATAVKIGTGLELPEKMIDILYDLFDLEDEKSISYKKLTSVFRTRLEMSSRAYLEDSRVSFRRCLFMSGYRKRITDSM